MGQMTKEEYESLLADLEWMKTYCPDRTGIISFAEKFVKYVRSVYRDHQEDYNAAFNGRNRHSSV